MRVTPGAQARGSLPPVLTGCLVCGYILLRSRIIQTDLVGCASRGARLIGFNGPEDGAAAAEVGQPGPRGGLDHPGLAGLADADSKNARRRRRLGRGPAEPLPFLRGRHWPAAGTSSAQRLRGNAWRHSAEARPPSPAPQPRGSPGTGKCELRAQRLPAAAPLLGSPAWPRSASHPNFFIIVFLIGCYSSEWMTPLLLKSNTNSFWFEEVSRLALLEIFSPHSNDLLKGTF